MHADVPDKYVVQHRKAIEGSEQFEENYNELSFGEHIMSWEACSAATAAHRQERVSEADAEASFEFNGNCTECLASGGALKVEVHKQRKKAAIDVAYWCINSTEVKFPGYLGESRLE